MINIQPVKDEQAVKFAFAQVTKAWAIFEAHDWSLRESYLDAWSQALSLLDPATHVPMDARHQLAYLASLVDVWTIHQLTDGIVDRATEALQGLNTAICSQYSDHYGAKVIKATAELNALSIWWPFPVSALLIKEDPNLIRLRCWTPSPQSTAN